MTTAELHSKKISASNISGEIQFAYFCFFLVLFKAAQASEKREDG